MVWSIVKHGRKCIGLGPTFLERWAYKRLSQVKSGVGPICDKYGSVSRIKTNNKCKYSVPHRKGGHEIRGDMYYKIE